MPLRTGLLFTLLLFTIQASQITDLHDQDVPNIRDVKHRHFLETNPPTKHTAKDLLVLHRERRAILFTTGVKVCPQDSMKDVITSHRAYYKLRICQEAVWEAFRIFLDRVPNTEEYKQWVYSCHNGSICLDDMAKNFSSTQEHLDMVAKCLQSARVAAEEAEKERAAVGGPVPTGKPEGEKCMKPPSLLTIPINFGEASEVPNLVPEDPLEVVVEFSVTIVDPGYSELLTDPETPQYQDITQDLHNKMLHVFNKLPGFKEIRVLGLFLKKSLDLAVRYAVVFDGVTDTARDKTDGTLAPGDSEPELTLLKEIVTNALRAETSLPVDIDSLSFDDVATVEMSAPDFVTFQPAPVESPGEGFFPTLAVMEDNGMESLTVQTYTYVPLNIQELSEGIASSHGPREPPPLEDTEETLSIDEPAVSMDTEVAVDTEEEKEVVEVVTFLPANVLAAEEEPVEELPTPAKSEAPVTAAGKKVLKVATGEGMMAWLLVPVLIRVLVIVIFIIWLLWRTKTVTQEILEENFEKYKTIVVERITRLVYGEQKEEEEEEEAEGEEEEKEEE